MSKRDDIIDAALKEFGKNNYDAASINKIIKVSGTSKGTFYHYFDDKKTLYKAIIEKSMKIKQMYMARMMEQVSLYESDLFDVLKAQVRAIGEFSKEYPDYFKFGTRFISEKGDIQKELLDQYMPDVGDTFLKIINTGISKGTFSKRYPPEFIAKIVWYLTMNYYDIFFDAEEDVTTEKIGDRMEMLFDFLKRGFS